MFSSKNTIFLAFAVLAFATPGAAWPTTTTTSTKSTSTSTKSTSTSKSTSSTSTSTSITKTTSTTQTPTATCVPYYALNQLARFDNDGSVANEVLADTPIDLYLDVYWNGWSLVSEADPSQGLGIAPQSPPNVAAFSPTDAATIQQGQPSMTTVYPDTTVNFFSLYSFYFGCVLADQNTVASLPQSCVLTVTGFNTNSQIVATQAFTFTANGALQQQMMPVALSSAFVNLQTATFEVQPAPGSTLTSNLTLAVLADTFNYTVYSLGIIFD